MNAGKYKHRIVIYKTISKEDNQGFLTEIPQGDREVILTAKAAVKTTRGITLIKNGSDFEKAYTNFTIRMPKPLREINRDMMIDFNGKIYSIEYLNDIDEAGVELEIQAKEVTH